MYQELKEIDYVFYFKQCEKYVSVIINDKKATVESTGVPWFPAAYGNALICLKRLKMTDKLYLLNKKSVKGFNPVIMSKEEQIAFLEKNANKIITRKAKKL